MERRRLRCALTEAYEIPRSMNKVEEFSRFPEQGRVKLEGIDLRLEEEDFKGT